MNFFTKFNLWKSKKQLSPSRQFKRELWQELSSAWQGEHRLDYAWYQQKWFRYSLAVVGGLFVVSAMGTGVYAYTSPEITEGTKLYSIKLGLEAVEETLSRSPEAKAKLYLKRLKRREAEKKVLEKKHAQLERVEEQIKRTENKLEDVEKKIDRNEGKLLEKVKERLEKRKERLEKKEAKMQNKIEKMEKRNRGKGEKRKEEKIERLED